MKDIPSLTGYQMQLTSYDAAKEIEHSAKSIRELCYRALKCRAMTADELATALGFSVLTIRPRVAELKKQLLIKDSELRRRNESGKFAVVWTTEGAVRW